MNATQDRYRVTLKSESSHCCFAASVIDTQRLHEVYVHKKHTVCECFDAEDARLICKALNTLGTPSAKTNLTETTTKD